MHLQITDFELNVPDWLVILVLAFILVQTIVSLVGSYYSLKLAKLKNKELKNDR